jgi:hypothetical protein
MESAEGQQCCIHILKLSSGHGTHSFPRAVVVAVHGSRSYITYLVGIRCVLCYLDAEWSAPPARVHVNSQRSRNNISMQRAVEVRAPYFHRKGLVSQFLLYNFLFGVCSWISVSSFSGQSSSWSLNEALSTLSKSCSILIPYDRQLRLPICLP